MGKIEGILVSYLGTLRINAESYYNTKDHSYYYSGNADDDIEHGFLCGEANAKIELYELLKDCVDLSAVSVIDEGVSS